MGALPDRVQLAPRRIDAAARPAVLHVPYTYFPDAVGGTEIYVAGLAAALRAFGLANAIAAPAPAEAAYRHNDVPVFRFATARGSGLAQAYGAADEVAARSFAGLLDRLRPPIVHLHARTAAVSERLPGLAQASGAKVVFTYHTPTVSCARGTMMWMGQTPCDGRLDAQRCARCTLAAHGVPPVIRDAIARTPPVVGHALSGIGLAGGAFTALRMPAMIGAHHRRFADLLRRLDRIVAPCDWVVEVLRRNGVDQKKLVLCRQGLSQHTGSPGAPPADRWLRDAFGVLRLGYFGRLDPAKGLDTVIAALCRVPDVPMRLAIYSIRQPGSEAYAAKLERAAARDPRIAILPALPPAAVGPTMAGCDFVVVPSRGLETGPLVVLEAFAAGTPVLGARRGGIAELVGDEIDGLLLPPEDPDAWASAIAALAASPERVQRLRAAVHSPRTMNDVARDMAKLYRTLLADAAG